MRPTSRFASARRQGGSIIVQTAIAMSLIVILLIGSELSYLFYVKREMQKAVDLAAMAGAQSLGATGCGPAQAAAIGNAAQNLPAGLTLGNADVTCGRWDPALFPAPRHFSTTSALPLNAVSVTMNRTPALLLPAIPGNQARTIVVHALAAQRLPRAALTLRSTLVSVDSTRSTLLNAVVGGMLGGTVSLNAVGWNGMINSNVKLLGYLDQLAIDLGVGVGQYEQVLSTQTNVSTLLQAAITAMQRQGDTAQSSVDALNALIALRAAVPAAQPLVRLGDLLGVQSGTPAAGLGVDLQVFQLVQGFVQLASGASAASAVVPISVPGVLNVNAFAKVIEPPRMSAIGDPRLARLNPTGPNKIEVRGAQVRTLITVELPVLNGITSLVNAVSAATAPLISTLNSVLTLNLGNLLACAVVCTNQLIPEVTLLPGNMRIDVNLDVASGNSHVTDFSCAPGPKSLTAATTTSIANLRIGKMGGTVAQARAQVFASAAAPHVDPLPLLDVSAKLCTKVLFVLMTCGPSQPFYGGGLALQGDASIGQTSASQLFADPPDVGQPPLFQAISTQNIVNTVGQTLQSGSALVRPIAPTGSPNGGQPNVLIALVGALNSVVGALGTLVTAALSPLVDPLLNTVLNDLLGIQLAQTEVGGQLTCLQGAQLVY